MSSTPAAEIADRLARNLARVDSLIAIYERGAGVRSGRASVGDSDLLRAAVVFLHAAFEDVLRSVLEVRWPTANDPELFRRVPFVLADGRRPEKLGVGDLARHLRGKTIEDVVRDSVNAHLEHSSFGDIADVTHALARAGIESHFLARYARGLYTLMQRRHWIVHRADKNDRWGPGHHSTRSIPLADVRSWRAGVEPACRSILARL